MALIIGLVSYLFYPDWLAATPLLAIIAAAAALAVLDQLGGALGFIDKLFPGPGRFQGSPSTDRNSLAQHSGQVTDAQTSIIIDSTHLESNPHLIAGERINQQSSSFVFKLHERMAEVYDLNEIKLLCFSLGVDYDELAGNTKSLKIEALITFLRRRGRLDELTARAKEDRPHIDWPEMPVITQEEEIKAYPLGYGKAKSPPTEVDIFTIQQQAHTVQEALLVFQDRLSIRREIIPAFKELSVNMKQLTGLVENYLQENTMHFLKRVLENNIEAVLNECETVKHELRQALLRTNQKPFNDFTQEPKDALIRLNKNWANLIANLEKVIDSPVKK